MVVAFLVSAILAQPNFMTPSAKLINTQKIVKKLNLLFRVVPLFFFNLNNEIILDNDENGFLFSKIDSSNV